MKTKQHAREPRDGFHEFSQGSHAFWIRFLLSEALHVQLQLRREKIPGIETRVLRQPDAIILYPSVIRIGNVFILLTGGKQDC